jgi:selenocysteine-specific elongation factor
VHVIATAGHVDHGKSTLVRALTGADPDRLGEEHRRGLSIELGYCWTCLPGGDEVAFVDVPGHERFISTMLAGVGPVPAVLFVVAADDPWMPQAAEHLAALDGLQVRHGLLVVTRSDLADPAPATRRALDEIARTSLGDVAAVAVSGRTGAGLDELRAALADLVRGLPPPRVDGDVRLWVDRRFSISGAGPVVTGTLTGGRIVVGDRLCLPDGPRVRVRGVQTLGRDVTEVAGTARVALSLSGAVPVELTRGSALVTPDAWLATTTIDVTTSTPQDLPAHPLLYIGATSVATRTRVLGGSFVRLSLDRPLPLRVGDRVLLRDPGSRALWGAAVVDPDPPPLRRRGAGRDRAVALAADTSVPPSLRDELARRGTLRASVARRLGYSAEAADGVAVRVGDWLLDRAALPTLQSRLRSVVEAHARASTLDPALATSVAASRLGLPTPDLVAALVVPPLRLDDSGKVTAAAASTLPPALAAALDTLERELADRPYAAPTADRLSELRLDPKSVGAAVRAGRLLRLADGIVLLSGADRAAAARLASLPQPFTTSQARVELGTSRRVALPLLAHLDRLGLTRRLPDDRRMTTDKPR